MSTKKTTDAELIQAVLAPLQDILAQQQRARAQEAARRAALTPEQRAAEDTKATAQRAAAERAALLAKYSKVPGGIAKRDSWTLDQFSWLLAGEAPRPKNGYDLLDFPSGRAQKAHDDFEHVLGSCVGTLLTSLNPGDPPEQRRYRTSDLILAALAKDLGEVRALREFIEPHLLTPSNGEPSTPDAAASPSAPVRPCALACSANAEPLAASTPDETSLAPVAEAAEVLRPEERVIPELPAAELPATPEDEERRRDILAVVEALCAERRAYKDGIWTRLLMSGAEFRNRLRKDYPRWSRATIVTLRRDRKHLRITVLRGRPSKNPALHSQPDSP